MTEIGAATDVPLGANGKIARGRQRIRPAKCRRAWHLRVVSQVRRMARGIAVCEGAERSEKSGNYEVMPLPATERPTNLLLPSADPNIS